MYKRVGKSVILVGRKAPNRQQMHLMGVKKSRRRSGFVIYLYFKDSTFAAVTRGGKFETSYVKEIRSLPV